MTTILNSALWSMGGFVGGFSFCWVLNRSTTGNGVTPVGVFGRPRMDYSRALLGVLILVMGVFASVQYYRVTSCQSTYNAAVAEALSQRSDAQRVTSQAQVTLLTVTLAGDQLANQRAIRDYIDALTRLEQVRAATPYPQPAECGDFK